MTVDHEAQAYAAGVAARARGKSESDCPLYGLGRAWQPLRDRWLAGHRAAGPEPVKHGAGKRRGRG